MRDVFAAGEEPDEWPALLRAVITDGAMQHRISAFERVDDFSRGSHSIEIQLHFIADAGECAQMMWEYNADHGESKNPNNQNPSSKQIPNPDGKISLWEIL
jgi:hypothetical protein